MIPRSTPTIYRMSNAARLRDLVKRSVHDDRIPDRLREGVVGTRNLARHASRCRRALPSFIIIGAHKSGTTSLYDYLAKHPQVVPSLEKEVHYFDLYSTSTQGCARR